jgi:hypothetical protein
MMRTVSAKAGVRDARTADTARTSREIREIDRIISHSIQRPPWVSATSPRPEGNPRGFGILWMTVGLGLIALIFANAGAILANASARYELMAFKNANSLRKPEKRGKSLGQGGAKTATPILKSPETSFAKKKPEVSFAKKKSGGVSSKVAPSPAPVPRQLDLDVDVEKAFGNRENSKWGTKR